MKIYVFSREYNGDDKKLGILTCLFVIVLEILHFKCAIGEERKTNFKPMALSISDYICICDFSRTNIYPFGFGLLTNRVFTS